MGVNKNLEMPPLDPTRDLNGGHFKIKEGNENIFTRDIVFPGVKNLFISEAKVHRGDQLSLSLHRDTPWCINSI